MCILQLILHRKINTTECIITILKVFKYFVVFHLDIYFVKVKYKYLYKYEIFEQKFDSYPKRILNGVLIFENSNKCIKTHIITHNSNIKIIQEVKTRRA